MTSVYQWHRPHLLSDRRRETGVIWGTGAMVREYFQMGWGKKQKKNNKRGGGAAFSLCATTRACCPLAFLSLCQNYFWLEKESVYSVAWFAGVTPCSHRANPLFPIQNGLHIFPVTQGLKRMRGKSRGWRGETLLLLLDLHAVSCSPRLRSFSGNNTEDSLSKLSLFKKPGRPLMWPKFKHGAENLTD